MSPKNDKEGRKSGLFGNIPFGSILDIINGIGSIAVKYLAQRYEVEQKVEQLKEDAKQKVEELKQEAIETGYALKKAIFRTIFEAVLLVTGLLALILGLILTLSDMVPLKWVLLGYGVIVTAFVALQLKTSQK